MLWHFVIVTTQVRIVTVGVCSIFRIDFDSMDGPASTHPNAAELLRWTLDNWTPQSSREQQAPAGRGQHQRSRLLRLKTRGVRLKIGNQNFNVDLLDHMLKSINLSLLMTSETEIL